jgi:hypothetical protein
MTIRHLGRGYLIYQPSIFQGALPRDEKSAAALFVLAATNPAPVPVVAEMDVMRLRLGLRRQVPDPRAINPATMNRRLDTAHSAAVPDPALRSGVRTPGEWSPEPGLIPQRPHGRHRPDD